MSSNSNMSLVVVDLLISVFLLINNTKKLMRSKYIPNDKKILHPRRFFVEKFGKYKVINLSRTHEKQHCNQIGSAVSEILRYTQTSFYFIIMIGETAKYFPFVC